MTTKTIATAVILLAAIPATAGSTAPLLTTTQPVASVEAGWHWRIGLDGWMQALKGDATVLDRTVDVDLGIDDTLENLDFAAMGVVELGYGKWSFIADLNYAELGASNNTDRTEIDLDISQFIGNFVVSYNVIDNGCTRFDVYAGARVNSMDMDLDITINGVRDFSRSGSKTWVDPIIGVRFQQFLSEKWFLRSVGDIGGFGVSSDLTWQALAMVGYRVSDNSNVVLGYRGIGTDYEDGDFGFDAINHGPLIGFEYKF